MLLLSCSADAKLITVDVPDTDTFSECTVKNTNFYWGMNGDKTFYEHFTTLIGKNQFGTKEIHSIREVNSEIDTQSYDVKKEISFVWGKLMNVGVCPKPIHRNR